MNTISKRFAKFSFGSCICVATILLVGLGCRSLPTAKENEVRDVSLVKLIANPERYDGKRIRVKGYATLGFEDSALYMLPSFHQYGMECAIILRVDPTIEGKRSKYHEKIVIIEGCFTDDQEAKDLYAGSIGDITRFEVWRNLDGTYPVREPRTPEEKLKNPDPWGDY